MTEQQNELAALQSRNEMQSQELLRSKVIIDGLADQLIATRNQCTAQAARIKELERPLEIKRLGPAPMGSLFGSYLQDQEMEDFEKDKPLILGQGEERQFETAGLRREIQELHLDRKELYRHNEELQRENAELQREMRSSNARMRSFSTTKKSSNVSLMRLIDI